MPARSAMCNHVRINGSTGWRIRRSNPKDWPPSNPRPHLVEGIGSCSRQAHRRWDQVTEAGGASSRHPDYELAAAPSTPSIEAPLDEHVDVFTLSHWCRAGMPRRMVDQIGLIIGRTNDPKPAHAQLCGRVPRARKALFYRRPRDFPARQDWFPNITQEHRTILPHELLAASQPHSAWRCGTLSATFAA